MDYTDLAGSAAAPPRRELETERVDALTTPFLQGDLPRFADAVEIELVRAGGRGQAGFVR